MLRQISLRNFVIVEALDLDIAAGMTVLTGETGAGKSILLDALGLALGDRGDAGVVRHGSDKAEVSVEFSSKALPEINAWLSERDLDMDDRCVLRRVIGSDGRSRAYINGQPHPIGALKELGEQLVDIHGQHEHQSLMKRDAQRRLLDAYAGLEESVSDVARLHGEWKNRLAEQQDVAAKAQERQERLELLNYQVEELQKAEPNGDEWRELNEEHHKLANMGQLLTLSQACLEALSGEEEGNVQSLLGSIARRLDDMAELDANAAPIQSAIAEAVVQIDEASRDLQRYGDSLDLDPARLQWAEERIGLLVDLARKHHCEPEELDNHLLTLESELNELEQVREQAEGLDARTEAAFAEYTEAARKLSDARQKAADELSEQVSAVMSELSMVGGRFQVHMDSYDPSEGLAHGIDRIEFFVSANPGQPAKPLSKVASGGELARISLAIQVITAARVDTPTLVFDEVDAGIGGGTAEIVGRKLRQLAEHTQVMCVTHLPQVAAQGHQHLQVSKQTTDGQTSTHIQPLTKDERIQEIARMLGGTEITKNTLAHAREMISRSLK
ncbi:MAG: DNA repair protein RecN [Gammaproteobacteria bacterium]